MPIATPYTGGTADDLIDQVRARVQDVDSESYSDALLLDYLNAGLSNLATLSGAWVRTETVTPAFGRATLPEGTIGVLRIPGLSWSPPGEMTHWITESSASAYCVTGRMLHVNTNATSTLTLESYYALSAMESGTPHSLPSTALDPLVMYAVYRVRDNDGDGAQAASAYNEYLNLTKALQGASVMEGK